MHCKSLWIKASAKCINENVKENLVKCFIFIKYLHINILYCINIYIYLTIQNIKDVFKYISIHYYLNILYIYIYIYIYI